MTTIAWDGTTLAADKRAVNGSIIFTTTKIKRINGQLVAGAGQMATILEVFDWLERGGYVDEFPSVQRDDDTWSPILVITKDKRVLKYEQTPYPIEYEDKTFAMGSGRELALCAMYCGKSAKEAVEIASIFDSCTGNGVDTLKFKSKS